MKRTLLPPGEPDLPAPFVSLARYPVYDSSCSPAARVYFIDCDGGYFLKQAARGSLEREAQMTRFFHEKGLGAQVLAYESLAEDYLLTRRIPGEDCLHRAFLDAPARLCDLTAQLLRQLHDTDHSGCPVPDRTAEYLEHARNNFAAGQYDKTLFPDNWGYASATEAWQVLEEGGKYLHSDTLLHGDYCLPNIILQDWRFSGFIDLDSAGVGDRHVDLFWGIWSLQFNLKTDAYRERFLDAYGREKIQPELLRVVAAAEVFA